MLSEFKDGVIGLSLFISQWLSQGGTAPTISIAPPAIQKEQSTISATIGFSVKEQFIDLLDAGIPLRIRIMATTNTKDTTTLLRTLSCRLSDYTYSIIDSSVNIKPTYVYVSKKYTQAFVAMHDYAQFTFVIPPSATLITIEATLLQSKASQLNRIVDMSQLFGFQKLSKSFEIR